MKGFKAITGGDVIRGAKPTAQDLKMLNIRYDVGTVIDFCIIGQKNEAKLVQQQGMKYVNIPINPVLGIPDKAIKKFFDIIEQAKDRGQRVFIHCLRGKDRTGTFAAMYKLKNNLGDFGSCVEEMSKMGYSRLCFPLLFTNLKKFSRTLS